MTYMTYNFSTHNLDLRTDLFHRRLKIQVPHSICSMLDISLSPRADMATIDIASPAQKWGEANIYNEFMGSDHCPVGVKVEVG